MLCLEKPHVGQALHQKGMFRHTFTGVASRRAQAWGSCSPQRTVGSWPSPSAGIRGGQCAGDTERRGDAWAQGSRAAAIWPLPHVCVDTHSLTHTHCNFIHSSVNGYLCCFLICPGTCAQSLSRVWLSVTPWTVACRTPRPQDFPGKNTGIGCNFLLRGTFLTQGLNPSILYHWAT